MSALHWRVRSALFSRAIGAIGLLALAACGGGGSDSPAPSTPAPTPAAPVAQAAADSYTLAWNAPSTLSVTDNDTATGGTATVTIDSAPKSGTATVSGTQVIYTPTAGFFGTDSFSYKLSVGSASQSATVSLAVEATVTLQGQVTDGPIANASVKAGVGSQSFSATADALGKYSVDIKTRQPGDFVTLTATGAGPQTQVVLTSLVGETRSLAAAAKDGKLAADQRPSLNVTHVTAVQAGLISPAGPLPKTEAELATALQGLSPQAVLDSAAAVKLVVDSGVALPTGVADTSELLNSASALGLFQATLLRDWPVALEAARQSTRDDPLVSRAPPTPATNADPVTLVYAYGEEGGTTQVHVLTLKADGTGTDLSDQPRSITWKLDDRAVAVTYDRFIEKDYEAFDLVTVGDKVIESEAAFKLVIRGLRLSDLGIDSGQGTLASVVTVASTLDLDGPRMGVMKEVKGGELMRRHVPGALAFKPEDFPAGTRLAGVSAAMGTDPGGMLQSNQDVATFTSGTSLTLARTAQTVSWKINDGKLRMDLPQASHLYTLLGRGARGDSRWLLQRLDANGTPLSAHELGVIPATATTVDRALWLSKTWRSNIGMLTNEPIFVQLLEEARASLAVAALGTGPLEPNFRRYWRLLDDGRVDIVRAQSASCVVYLPTGAPGPTACALTQQRFWQPVARTGNTLWVLQQGPIVPGEGNEATAGRWSLVALTGN